MALAHLEVRLVEKNVPPSPFLARFARIAREPEPLEDDPTAGPRPVLGTGSIETRQDRETSDEES